MSIANSNLTELVHAWQRGEPDSENDLFVRVYDELRRRAASYMRRERPNHTLQSTAVVHEAWLELRQVSDQIKNREHFFALAATMMRHILVEYARSRAAEKRGGNMPNVTLSDDLPDVGASTSVNVLDLNEALQDFALIDPEKHKIVEMRFFGGMTIEEIAVVTGRGERSVKRDWSIAKAWLAAKLG